MYFTLLASVALLTPQKRDSIHRNVTQILQLHEDLLSELHNTIPHAECNQDESQQTFAVLKTARHGRWHSVGAIPGRVTAIESARVNRHSLDIGKATETPAGLIAETKTAGDVAKVFNKHVSVSSTGSNISSRRVYDNVPHR